MSAQERVSTVVVGTGPIGPKKVLLLAWPFMVSMLGHTATSVVDTIFVGRLGTAPLAGVGVANVAAFLVTAFPMGLVAGVRIQVAQHTGAGDDDTVRRLMWHGLWIGLVLGLLLLPAGFADARLFSATGSEPEVAAQAAAYFSVRVLGTPSFTLLWAFSAWFQGRGDTRTPMVATLLANGLNLVLDPLLIFGWGPVPGWGAAGAAAATVASLGLGAAWLGWRAWKQVGRGPRGLDFDLLGRVWRVGGPVGVRYLLDVASFAAFVGILAHSGAVQMAAHVIAVRIASVSFMPGHALGEAAGVLAGQALGAGRATGAREAFRAGTRVSVAIMLAWASVFVLWPDPLIAAFGPEPDVAAVALQLLLIAAAFQLGDGIAVIAFGVLSGAGDTRFTLLASVTIAWLCKLPLGWYLAIERGWGAPGAWLGLTFEIAMVAVVGVLRVRGSRWLDNAVLPRVAGAEPVEGLGAETVLAGAQQPADKMVTCLPDHPTTAIPTGTI